METKELIIQLIQQDMKHQQLVEYICKAGFETHKHHLNLLNIVARLMGIEENSISDEWIEVYMDYLGNTIWCPVGEQSDVFRVMAEECYVRLREAE